MSNTGLKGYKKDRNKLHLTLPGVPSPLSYDKSQEDTCLSVHAGCDKSEESQYVEMKQSGTISQQVIQPVIVM